MFKQVFFLWKRLDLSTQQFKAHYERNHAPLASGLFPALLLDYRRNYPRWASETRAAAGGFDVMTEIWCEDRGAFEALRAGLMQPAVRAVIAADEERFFIRGTLVMVVVDEIGAAQSGGAAAKVPLRKFVRFLTFPAGSDGTSLRDDYERALAALDIPKGLEILDHRRNYVRIDDPLNFIGNFDERKSLDGHARIFDMMEELWVAGAAPVAEELGARLPVIPGAVVHETWMEEHRSPVGRPAAPVADDFTS